MFQSDIRYTHTQLQKCTQALLQKMYTKDKHDYCWLKTDFDLS